MGARRACIAISAALIGLVAPAAAIAQTTAADHREDDTSSPKTAQQERALTRETVAATAGDARVAAAAVAADPGQVGSWSAPVDWPVVGVHVALLPNGKVLAYDSVGDNATETYAVHDHTRATVWDPATGTQTDVQENGFNIFCSGLAHLLDGSVFVAGGNKDSQLNGIRQTHVFDATTNTWTRTADMTYERWYPSVTALRNGEMLITEGRPDVPEVRMTNGSIRALSTASLNLPLYPWLDTAPDGRAFYSGPDQTMRTLDTAGTGAWQSFAQRDSINRDYGGHALYDIGKILVAGGGPSTNQARTIDLNGATPTTAATASMQYGRRQNNLTLLADGTALATGGNSSGAGLVDLNAPVLNAEQWTPATGQWKTLAAQQVTRQYHSSALLLPDGRVLSSGGGICGTCDTVHYLAKNAEVFTPPYLYKQDGSGELAPRPTVTNAPATIEHGTPFAIDTPDAASITKVALVRLGAVTHSNDMDQRYVPLSYTAGAGTLTATAPANASITPPGPYMLFVIDAAGVPSVARMVSMALQNAAPAVSLTQPASGASFVAPATINLAATATDDGSVAKVEFFNGQTKLGEDLSAPYTYAWTGVPVGTYAITARATDNTAKTTTSAPVSVTVRAVNVAPSVSITSPANGAVFGFWANVTINASASDSDGTVSKVEFFRNNTKLGEDATAPYSYTWMRASSGNHTLTAKATDNLGAATTSAPVSIKVKNLFGG